MGQRHVIRALRGQRAQRSPVGRTMPVAEWTVLGIAVLFLTAALPSAIAQTIAANRADTAEQDDRSDQIQDQEDAIDAAQDTAQAQQAAAQAVPAAPREFSVRLNVPLSYNSNPEEAPSGGPAALEADPEIELGWTRSLTSVPLKITARLRADTDRYVNVPQAGEDEASGSVKAAYYDADNDQAWAPFVSYKGSTIFDPTFSPWTETRNDFALGFDKYVNFDGDFNLLPPSQRSRAVAVWSFGVSAFVQRRLRTPGPDSTALYLVPSVTYALTEDWIVSLFVNTRERWFDSVKSPTSTTSRRDFEIEPILTIAYDPKFPGAPQIALQASFERRSSNLPDKSWNQWTIGPVLTASWRF
jgi:hypothetical protein